MKPPTHRELIFLKSQGCKCASYAGGVHPNPRFYKYQWWVFWADSPVEGREFLKQTYALNTCEFVNLMVEMERMNESSIIYNNQTPRHEPGVTPFDLASPKWAGWSFAPAWHEDCDPVVVDKKSRLFGHR